MSECSRTNSPAACLRSISVFHSPPDCSVITPPHHRGPTPWIEGATIELVLSGGGRGEHWRADSFRPVRPPSVSPLSNIFRRK